MKLPRRSTTTASRRSHRNRQRRFYAVLHSQIALAEQRTRQREAAFAAQVQAVLCALEHGACITLQIDWIQQRPCYVRQIDAERLCYSVATTPTGQPVLCFSLCADQHWQAMVEQGRCWHETRPGLVQVQVRQ